MHLSFALLLSTAVPAQPAPLSNLDFGSGTLTNWEGDGFNVFTQPYAAVTSADVRARRTGLLHRTFVLPRDAGAVIFRAAAFRPEGVEPGGALEVLLEGAERKMAPRFYRSEKGLKAASTILPDVKGRLVEYVWNVDRFAGQTVRICILDQDERPGCYLVCSGFTVVSRDEFNAREFGDHMLRLCREQKLVPVERFDSKRFMSISNAEEGFTERQLLYCETMYDLFFDHFRRKKFAIREPRERLMVAIFDSQTGFEAYMGQRMPNVITGVYHPPSNRLVVYDFAQNRGFREGTEKFREKVKTIPATLEGKRLISAFSREVRDVRDDANIGTIMHEVAHQLTFNCGMMNREGDVPAWLAEGSACYCEGTDNGQWLGIGEANPMRAMTLARQGKGEGPYNPVRSMIQDDDWLKKGNQGGVLLGYAQSWALFRLLMEERPEQLRKYLTTIYPRKTPDHRLADFVECFGDPDRLDIRYFEYIKEVVKEQAKLPK